VAPAAIEGLAGVSAIDSRVGAVTVNVVMPLTEFKVAVIVELPCARPLAKPVELMLTAFDDELQVTVFVRICVLPSV
jgi:hypothetical protein